ncbi:carboxypeptidase-like regulatory domain-containing protein [Sphingobacterium sp. E70]|nr:carboxypeptidase-like regulatory domain-containing protein [Sphingobacterium sp. E70]ULT23834.1 carboxypeptidase-like regulatory domain-containing protein [Sphingobacterium sp. E70]
MKNVAGEPIAGASILNTSTGKSTQTDANGAFIIQGKLDSC